jgi:hypothetical protein
VHGSARAGTAVLPAGLNGFDRDTVHPGNDISRGHATKTQNGRQAKFVPRRRIKGLALVHFNDVKIPDRHQHRDHGGDHSATSRCGWKRLAATSGAMSERRTIDRAPAALRLCPAHQDEGFIGAGVLDDLVRFDQGAADRRESRPLEAFTVTIERKP